MKTNIIQQDNPVLRQIASPIYVKDISSKKTSSVISSMKTALHKEDDGVAIAAPQIGESVRIFIVSGSILASINRKKRSEEEKETPIPDMICINPEFIRVSKKKKLMDEGCLSVRWLYGKVWRSEKVTLRAHDENGELFEKGASGLLAQIFQHEMDHLNGILFIDTAEDVHDHPPHQHEPNK